MDNKKYTSAVESENYPTDPTVPLAFNFKDGRGVIQNLLFTPLNSVAMIESKKGSIRSNHYHKNNSHYLYIVSGSVEYFERDIDGGNVFTKTYGPGEMIFSAPNRVHKTVFLDDTIMVSMAKEIKMHDEHEADLVRMEF